MFGPGPLVYMAAASELREAVHRPLGGHGGMVVTEQAGQGLPWVSGRPVHALLCISAFSPCTLWTYRKRFPHIASWLVLL